MAARGIKEIGCTRPKRLDPALAARLLANQQAAARRAVRAHTTDATISPDTSTGPSTTPVPDWCALDGNLAYTRNEVCGILSGTWFAWDSKGNVIGTIEYNYITDSYSEPKLTNWAHQLIIDPTAFSGIGADGAWTVIGKATCDAHCATTNYTFPKQPVVLRQEENATSFYTTTGTARGDVAHSTTTWDWEFDHVGQAVAKQAEVTTLTIRCDNALPGSTKPGCVFPEYIPYIQYSLTGAYPQLAKHIKGAQASGLRGAYNSGTYLTRLTDSTLVTKNGTTSCKVSYPRPTGKSCDEYPFRSTHQGAYTAGGSPRTQSWCSIVGVSTTATGSTGYSVCMIDATQNSGGGTELGNFYYNWRVIESDRFQVWITS